MPGIKHWPDKKNRGSSIYSKFDKEELIEALYEKRGKISHAAKYLHVSAPTLYNYIEADEELQEHVKRALHYGEEAGIDDSEYTMEALQERIDKEPMAAFRSAKYVLDRKGSKRGWIVPTNTVDDGETIIVTRGGMRLQQPQVESEDECQKR